MPAFSVIVPVYNCENYLKRCVNSILNQTFRKIELILVDDGSTDDSLNILNTIKDSKVEVCSKKNGGPSAGRNFGIEKAKGAYLLFIDSDDDVKDDFVSKLVESMRSDKIALASTGVVYNRKSGVIEDLYLRPFLKKNGEKMEKYIL